MNFLKHHILIISVAASASVGIVSYAVWGISVPNKLEEVSVSRMNIQEEVHGDGSVKPAQAVDLAFERGGKITKVYAQTGDAVKAGQIIVALDGSDFYAQLAQAGADVKTQQAKLDELKRGARAEDLQSSEVRISNANEALDAANRAAVNTLQDVFTKSDDVIHNRISEFIKTDTIETKLLFYVNTVQTENDLKNEKPRMDAVIEEWGASLSGLNSTGDLSAAISSAKMSLAKIKLFIDKLASAVNDDNSFITINGAAGPFPLSTKADMSAIRATINSSISSVSSAEQGINAAQSNLASVRQELVIKQSGSSLEQISAQEAQLQRSKAGADFARSQLAKTVLRSPFDGLVSRQDAKAGAIAPSNSTLVSVISNSKYQIEIFVSETDVAKIKTEQAVKVTLDAYGESNMFDATIIKVDPAAEIVNGVSAFKITSQFVKEDERIKVGMGANVRIHTSSRENAIAVPQSALIVRGSDKIALVEQSGGVQEERKVESGITGSNGYVEILSGLEEGEQIAAFGAVQK